MNRTLFALGGAAALGFAAIAAVAAPVSEQEAEAMRDAAAAADAAARGQSSPESEAAVDGAAPFAEAVDNAAVAMGESYFAASCGSCHAIDPDKPSYVGPNLAGIFGQPAAQAEFRYSPALKNAGIVWTAEKLDAFLANPTGEVPGARMFVRTTDEAKRAAIIAYLSQAGG